MIALEHQIAEVKREIALRATVYPGLVSRGKMRQGEVDLHTARMQAVLKTLFWLEANEAAIKAALPLKDRPSGVDVDAAA